MPAMLRPIQPLAALAVAAGFLSNDAKAQSIEREPGGGEPLPKSMVHVKEPKTFTIIRSPAATTSDDPEPPDGKPIASSPISHPNDATTMFPGTASATQGNEPASSDEKPVQPSSTVGGVTTSDTTTHHFADSTAAASGEDQANVKGGDSGTHHGLGGELDVTSSCQTLVTSQATPLSTGGNEPQISESAVRFATDVTTIPKTTDANDASKPTEDRPAPPIETLSATTSTDAPTHDILEPYHTTSTKSITTIPEIFQAPSPTLPRESVSPPVISDTDINPLVEGPPHPDPASKDRTSVYAIQSKRKPDTTSTSERPGTHHVSATTTSHDGIARAVLRIDSPQSTPIGAPIIMTTTSDYHPPIADAVATVHTPAVSSPVSSSDPSPTTYEETSDDGPFRAEPTKEGGRGKPGSSGNPKPSPYEGGGGTSGGPNSPATPNLTADPVTKCSYTGTSSAALLTPSGDASVLATVPLPQATRKSINGGPDSSNTSTTSNTKPPLVGSSPTVLATQIPDNSPASIDSSSLGRPEVSGTSTTPADCPTSTDPKSLGRSVVSDSPETTDDRPTPTDPSSLDSTIQGTPATTDLHPSAPHTHPEQTTASSTIDSREGVTTTHTPRYTWKMIEETSTSTETATKIHGVADLLGGIPIIDSRSQPANVATDDSTSPLGTPTCSKPTEGTTGGTNSTPLAATTTSPAEIPSPGTSTSISDTILGTLTITSTSTFPANLFPTIGPVAVTPQTMNPAPAGLSPHHNTHQPTASPILPSLTLTTQAALWLILISTTTSTRPIRTNYIPLAREGILAVVSLALLLLHAVYVNAESILTTEPQPEPTFSADTSYTGGSFVGGVSMLGFVGICAAVAVAGVAIKRGSDRDRREIGLRGEGGEGVGCEQGKVKRGRKE